MKIDRRPHFVSSLLIVLFMSTFGCTEINEIVSPEITETRVETFAGNGEPGANDGQGDDARFHNPGAIAFDAEGNLFVADGGNNLIRMINTDGEVTTYAGTGEAGYKDGDREEALFDNPQGITFDLNGDLLIAEKSTIRKISQSGEVSTLAGISENLSYVDGSVNEATFNTLKSIVVDQFNHIYVSDYFNHVIRKISVNGEVSTFAGDGSVGNLNGLPDQSSFYHPQGMAINNEGVIYLADESNNQIRKINNGGVVEIAAGTVYGFENGSNTTAKFRLPVAVAIDQDNNVYVADSKNFRIRIIKSSGIVETLAGNGISGYKDDIGTAAILGHISSIAIDNDGNIYVADQSNHSIRKIVVGS